MKVLYIGHYKENSGWADAAVSHILALDSVGVDVVCRNVTLTQDKQEVHPRILQLEQKDTQGCTHCIQHVLPHHLVGTDHFTKNIAYLAYESSDITQISWWENLQMMDEVWVPNRSLQQGLQKHRPPYEVLWVPHPVDTSIFKNRHGNINIPEAIGKFKFYYIGDLNDRKNIDSVLTCFHSEFNPSEPVSLVLKVRKFGHSPEQLKEIVDQRVVNVKQSLRMYRDLRQYHKDIVISQDIRREDVFALHQHCDCFLNPSHGEGFSIPTFNAMGFGSFPIASNEGGPRDYLNNVSNGKLIDGCKTVCKCSDAAFPHIFTGREYWFQVDEEKFRGAMRGAFEQWKEDPVGTKYKWQQAGLKAVEEYSYEKIGGKMEILLKLEYDK